MQGGARHGLGQKGLNVTFTGLGAGHFGLTAGNHDDGYRVAHGSQAARRGQTIEAGQVPVEQHEVKLCAPLQPRQCRLAGVERIYNATKVSRIATEQGAHGVVVFHYQNTLAVQALWT